MEGTVWKCLLDLNESSHSSDYAILVLNQPILCDPRIIISLWNKATIRAIANGGSNRWLDFMKKFKGDDLKVPDFISGDFDSITPMTEAYFKSKDVPFITTPDQDSTDFTKALKCIQDMIDTQKLNVKQIFALCENSGRFDQIIGNVNTLHSSKFFLKDLPVIILSSQSVTWVLNPGKHVIYVTDEFLTEQYPCGLIPMCGPTTITTTGLKWNLDKDTSVIGGLISTSNTFTNNEVTVTCDKETVWTTQYCKNDS